MDIMKNRRIISRLANEKFAICIILTLLIIASFTCLFFGETGGKSPILRVAAKSISENALALVMDEFTKQDEATYTYDVMVNVDGEEKSFQSSSKTVRHLLIEQGIILDEDDEVSPSQDTVLSNGLVVDVLRVEYVIRNVEEKIPFTSESIKSFTMTKDTKKINQEGVDGIKTFVYKDKIINGNLQTSELVSESITKEPIKEIVEIGTLTEKDLEKLGNNKIERNGKPISEIQLPSKYTIDKNNVPTEYKYIINGRSAAYCIPGGTTSTGKKVKPGYIAVNPKQIPYGTEMWIVSDDGVVYGYAIAADTGGFAKKGYFTTDLYMNSVDQCFQWGDRKVTIYVL